LNATEELRRQHPTDLEIKTTMQPTVGDKSPYRKLSGWPGSLMITAVHNSHHEIHCKVLT
jgi:hypothetical protein